MIKIHIVLLVRHICCPPIFVHWFNWIKNINILSRLWVCILEISLYMSTMHNPVMMCVKIHEINVVYLFISLSQLTFPSLWRNLKSKQKHNKHYKHCLLSSNGKSILVNLHKSVWDFKQIQFRFVWNHSNRRVSTVRIATFLQQWRWCSTSTRSPSGDSRR